MKIKIDEIKRLYRAALEEKRLISREGCPDFIDLVDLLTKTSKKKKMPIRHVTSCPFCLEEVESILNIIRSEQNLLDDINLLIKRKMNRQDKTKNLSHKYVLKEFAPYAMTVLVLLVVTFIFFRTESTHGTGNRGKSTGIIQLISPIDNKVSRSSLKLEWTGKDKFLFSICELFDESLKPIWKSSRIYEKETIVPREISQILQKNRTYYWMATVFLENNRSLESSLAKFVIID